MKNKFNLTREQNVFVAKRNIVDYIWKSANLEGIGVTYPETQAIYDGGVVNGLTVDKIIAINNLNVLILYIVFFAIFFTFPFINFKIIEKRKMRQS